MMQGGGTRDGRYLGGIVVCYMLGCVAGTEETDYNTALCS